MTEPSADVCTPRITLTDPKQLPPSTDCPRCAATNDRRVLSGGFGEPHDVCGQCGYEFQERTL
jgi:transposase-like protein